MEKKVQHLIMLILLYAIQGFTIDFFIKAIPILLVENKVPIEDLTLFSFAAFPYTFKIFFAPFQDIYYSSFLGKRRTYILLSNLLLSLLFLSIPSSSLLLSSSLLPPTLALLSLFLSSFQDIAADSWGSAIFRGGHSIWVASAQNFGITAGSLVSNILVFQFKIGLEGVLRGVGIFIAVFTAVFFFKAEEAKEKEVERSNEDEKSKSKIKGQGQGGESWEDMFKMFFHIMRSPSLLLFSFFVLFHRLPFGPIDFTFKYRLVQMGVSTKELSGLVSIASLICLALPLFTAHLLKNKNELIVFLLVILIKYLENFASLYLLSSGSFSWIFVFLLLLFQHLFFNASYILVSSITSKIANKVKGYEATSLAFFASLMNLAKRIAEIASIKGGGRVEGVVLGWVGGVILFMGVGRKLARDLKVKEM